MKNLKDRLVLEKKSKVTVKLSDVIYMYFEGTDQDALEAGDFLFIINNDDNYELFKTYEEWFKYYNSNKWEKINVTVDALPEGGSERSAISFKLPHKKNASMYLECAAMPNDVIEVLTFLSTKFSSL